jgi:hypothetical protein
MADNVTGQSTDGAVAAVKGENTGSGSFGVWGICATGHGVRGDSTSLRGVVGTSQTFHRIYGNPPLPCCLRLLQMNNSFTLLHRSIV